jgi:hypothetical protein
LANEFVDGIERKRASLTDFVQRVIFVGLFGFGYFSVLVYKCAWDIPHDDWGDEKKILFWHLAFIIPVYLT